MQVCFYGCGEVADCGLRFAVIAAKSKGKWVFCRHQSRSTWEFPGGHREKGETMEEAAPQGAMGGNRSKGIHVGACMCLFCKAEWRGKLRNAVRR